jgi:hypothetical protein
MFSFAGVACISATFTQKYCVKLLRESFKLSILLIAGVILSELFAPPAFAENNLPPIIYDFRVEPGPDGFWTFSGSVYDPDDYVEGMTIYFGGVLAEYGYTATVRADGTFSLTVKIPELQGGIASTQTYDWILNPSNLALCYVLSYD